MILDGREGRVGDNGGKSTRFISHHEEEWQLVGHRVGAVIVCEFCEGNVLCPGSRIGAREDLKVSFYFLVDSLSFSICLRVVGSGEGKFITKEFS